MYDGGLTEKVDFYLENPRCGFEADFLSVPLNDIIPFFCYDKKNLNIRVRVGQIEPAYRQLEVPNVIFLSDFF